MASMDADATLQQLGGGFGRYHLFLATICALTTLFTGQPVVQDSFVNYTPDHRCYVPLCDAANTCYEEPFLNFTTPWSGDEWAKCEYHSPLANFTAKFYASDSFSSSRFPEPSSSAPALEQCTEDNFNSADEIKCDQGWMYDRTLFQASTTMDFDLVCDRSYITSLTASTYNIGMLFGSVLCGVMADKLGRKFAYLASLALTVFGSTGGALSVNPLMLVLMRIPTGFGAVALFQIAFILCAEYMPERHRSLVGFVLNTSFAVGEALVGVYAIFFREWRVLQLAIAVPPAIMFSYYWIMPESVRWLSSEGRDAEARLIVQRMAAVNRVPVPEIVYQEGRDEGTSQPSSEGQTSVWQLMRFPNMRRRSLILFFTWFTASMVYYGISQNIGNLAGNIFVNFILTMIIEIPSYLLTAVVFDKAGHKVCLVGGMLIAGVACTATGFIPAEQATSIVVLSLIGKFGGAAVFGALYVYSSELYPTSHRSTGLGCCSMFSRVAGIVAPSVALLGKNNPALPLFIFGTLALAASVAMLFLPETTGCRLTQTLSESEQMGAGQPWCFFPWCAPPTTEAAGDGEAGSQKQNPSTSPPEPIVYSVEKGLPNSGDTNTSCDDENSTQDFAG